MVTWPFAVEQALLLLATLGAAWLVARQLRESDDPPGSLSYVLLRVAAFQLLFVLAIACDPRAVLGLFSHATILVPRSILSIANYFSCIYYMNVTLVASTAIREVEPQVRQRGGRVFIHRACAVGFLCGIAICVARVVAGFTVSMDRQLYATGVVNLCNAVAVSVLLSLFAWYAVPLIRRLRAVLDAVRTDPDDRERGVTIQRNVAHVENAYERCLVCICALVPALVVFLVIELVNGIDQVRLRGVRLECPDGSHWTFFAACSAASFLWAEFFLIGASILISNHSSHLKERIRSRFASDADDYSDTSVLSVDGYLRFEEGVDEDTVGGKLLY